jgi:hypothetical protein
LPQDGSWVDPSKMAAELKMQADRLRQLKESRRDMPPAVDGWLADLTRVSIGLSEYAESCRQPAPEPASDHTEQVGSTPGDGSGEGMEHWPGGPPG